MTTYDEDNRPLPKKLLSQFRVAVGLTARPEVDITAAGERRLQRIHKVPWTERHRLFYDFWQEYFDWKVEATELRDESPDWLKVVADEIANECDWDL